MDKGRTAMGARRTARGRARRKDICKGKEYLLEAQLAAGNVEKQYVV